MGDLRRIAVLTVHNSLTIMGLFRKKKTKEVATGDAGTTLTTTTAPPNQPVELGTICYVNLTPDGRHGDMDIALQIAADTGRPIFCNFVEWAG